MAAREVLVRREDSLLQGVTVYSDRAEITRVLKSVKVAATGQSTVRLWNVSSDIDRNSIRAEGSGDANIADVYCTSEYNKDVVVQADSTTAKKLVLEASIETNKKKLETLEMEFNKETLKLEHNRNQDYLVSKFASMCTSGASTSSNGSADQTQKLQQQPISPEQFFGSFLEQYIETQYRLGSEMLELQAKANALEREKYALVQVIQEEESALSCLSHGHKQHVWSISIVVEGTATLPSQEVINDTAREMTEEKSETDTEIELTIVYVVLNNARWSPLYDVRMLSEVGTVKLTYYGNVVQKTGEDWNGCKLTLSTALVNNTSGTAPTFNESWVVQKREPPPVTTPAFMPRSAIFGSSPGFGALSSDSSRAEVSERPMVRAASSRLMSLPMHVITSEAQEGIISANFTIPGQSTIPSDNIAHRVTVAIVNLQPTLSYVAVPKKSESAFLMAKIVNTSPYTLLAGPSNVFHDHSFVSKSRLPLVLPQATFDTSLGIDPAIKVTYKHVRGFTENTGGGLLSRALVHESFTRRILVTNKRTSTITIRVIDQVPKSRDEDIVVTLIEPREKSMISFESQAEYDKAVESNTTQGKDSELSNKDKVLPGLSSLGSRRGTEKKDSIQSKDNQTNTQAGGGNETIGSQTPAYVVDLGTVEWTVTVPKNDQHELTLKFSVAYPKGVMITSLI